MSQRFPLFLSFVAFLAALIGPTSVAAEGAPDSDLRFGLPIECELGEECFVMKYFDTDFGPGETDSFCGRQTTDGHNGTDFAIPDVVTMTKGIPVIAIESGVVLHTRDGAPDELLGDDDEHGSVMTGDGCGNGLAIDHGGGWTSIYCHLKNGSLAVESGTMVKKGDPVGMIGYSGGAGYPHVHLTVSLFGQPVDPFVGPSPDPDCAADHEPLWEDSVPFQQTGLVDVGFAEEIPTRMEVWKGLHSKAELSPENLLVMWIHAFGVVEGDEYHTKVTSPEGEVVVSAKSVVEESARDWLTYSGVVSSSGFLKSGLWHGEFGLVRNGKTILTTSSVVTIR